MALTAIGRAALAAREGVRLKAYKDSVGVWTIGIGHTSAAGPPAVTPGFTITAAECDEIFARDLVQYEAAVDRAVKVPLADHERDALVSICYNIGSGAFAKSTFVKKLNAGDREGCAKAIMSWRKPPEIITRREAERDQFLTPYIVSPPKARSGDARPVRTDTLARAAPKAKQAAAAPPPAPTVTTVEPAGKAPGIFGALWNMLRGKKAVPAVPAIAGTKNDPTIFYVQKMLKERAYYTRGFVDGLDGGLTQQAVAQARKDNGMGDGGIDAEFLTRLPSFPQRPVSKERAEIGIVAATQHAPEVMKPSLGLLGTGLSLLGIGGADEIGGLMTQVQSGAAQAGEIMGTVQSAFGTVALAINWLVEHRRMVLILIGLFVVFKAISWLLSGWIKIRQAFF